jgi:hypothetical protein
MRGNLPDALRRSSRVPVNLPILVTSLAAGTHFSQICDTLVVNAHGCAMRSPVKLEAGVLVHFHSREGRETTAKVVDCQPIGPNQEGWRLGAQLEVPDNFWGLKSVPEDWARLPERRAATERKLIGKPPTNRESEQMGKQVGSSLKLVPEIEPQFSTEYVRSIIAEFVQPLHAEVSDLRTKLAQGPAKRSQFEVSQNHIPPELEEQLWSRLRNDLGAQALQHTREQTEELLTTAAITIETKVADGQEEFRKKLLPELQAVEQRAQSISADMAKRMRDHLATGLGEFQQQVLDSQNHLQAWSEELIRTLRQRLGEEYEAHRWQVQQVQAEVASESSRLQAQIVDLSSRMAKLDESTRRLESELDSHLEDMARSIVSHARAELESALEASLKELENRNAKELAGQLDDACAHLKIIQKGVEASASELLRTQVSQALQSLEHSMQDVAQNSLAKWRKTLAGGLNSLVNILGDQFRLEAGNSEEQDRLP